MSVSEFDLIDQYFKTCTRERPDVALGIGDDAALVESRTGSRLVTSISTVSERSPQINIEEPSIIARRVLAVAFNRVAIAGASPAWVTLALTLPSANRSWLESFAGAFGEMAERYGAQLIGGNTTRGSLCITVTVDGIVRDDVGILPAEPACGDIVCVSGRVGTVSSLLLAGTRPRGLDPTVRDRIARDLERPEPRVTLALSLASIASGACEISDGLKPSLVNLLHDTGLGASVTLDSVPLEAGVATLLTELGAWPTALSMGGDMELCFTVSPSRWAAALAIASTHGVNLSPIGKIEAVAGVRIE